jgi:rubredoxin-NAD+ reductase
MHRTDASVVIIGSGLGGYGLARELRRRDANLSITLITADDGASYSKPMLSNAFAQGKHASSLVLKDAKRMASDLGIQLLTHTTVTQIDRGAKQVLVSSNSGQDTIAYGKLVLALGADPRPYPQVTGEKVKIHSVNDLASYAAWRAGLRDGDSILLIGAGLIGCEFANDLTLAGYKVTVVDPAAWPLARLLPQEIGEALATALEGSGVVLKLGCSISQFTGNIAAIDDGTFVRFDHVLSAIGLLPRLTLARDAGLAVDTGIKVDAWLATSDPDIFALGDCAQTDAGTLPFILPLMAQLRALAASLTGEPTRASLPALPVTVKTPCLKLVVCSPPAGSAGKWTVEGTGLDRKGLFIGEHGAPLGYALAGNTTVESQALAKLMPAIL